MCDKKTHEVIRPVLHAPLTPIRADNVRCGPGGNFIVAGMGTAFLGSTIHFSATGYKPSSASDEKYSRLWLGNRRCIHLETCNCGSAIKTIFTRESLFDKPTFHEIWSRILCNPKFLYVFKTTRHLSLQNQTKYTHHTYLFFIFL
jgi:hypothetical protein